MIKLIPSKQVQEYLDEIHFTFTDFEKATLIWNNHLTTKEEKLIALKEMMNSTKDEMLKKQIRYLFRILSKHSTSIGTQNQSIDLVFIGNIINKFYSRF